MKLEKIEDNDISSLFEDARVKLKLAKEQAKEQAKKQLETNKKQIVVNLATSLEGLVRTDTICIRIVQELSGIVSARFVRKILDKKYKNKTRSKNADKQKKPLLEDKIIINELAEQVPLNNKEMVVVGTNGQSFIQREGDYDSEQSSNKDNLYGDEKTISPLSTKLPLKTEELEHQLKKQAEIHGLKVGPSYEELYYENLDLKEVLKKSNRFNADNNIKTTPDRETKIDNYQDNVFWKTVPEIREYIFPIFLVLGEGGNICVRETIDKNTGKVISLTLGGTDLSNDAPEQH